MSAQNECKDDCEQTAPICGNLEPGRGFIFPTCDPKLIRILGISSYTRARGICNPCSRHLSGASDFLPLRLCQSWRANVRVR